MIKNEILLASSGTPLSGIFWQADNPVAIVILVHGFGEHISRYEHVAQHFLKENISVLGVDLVGHGNSGGKRGHINSIEDFFGCIDAMIDHVKKENKGLPLILYGHSMGGNIVLNYLISNEQNEFCCGLATSPWLQLAIQPGAVQLFLAMAMNGIYPSLQQTAELDIKDISSVVEVQEDYASDPLNHDKISVRLFNEIYKNGLLAIETAGRINIPVLVAHGDADNITSAKGSEAFVANSEHAMLKIWPGLRHETHNEHNNEEVIRFYVDWVKHKLYS
jgi:alpha-beta hydrolase superfamily lysophospholipase